MSVFWMDRSANVRESKTNNSKFIEEGNRCWEWEWKVKETKEKANYMVGNFLVDNFDFMVQLKGYELLEQTGGGRMMQCGSIV